MSARAVGRVALIAVVIGLVAVVGEVSGVAPAWAVLLGVAVSLTGAPPVVPRGVTALASGAVTAAALWALAGVGLSSEPAAAATAALVVAVAGLARLRDDPRAPALAVLLGGGAVLAGAQLAGGTGIAEVAPALAGLVAGLLPMQVGEIVTGLRSARQSSEVGATDPGGAMVEHADAPGPDAREGGRALPAERPGGPGEPPGSDDGHDPHDGHDPSTGRPATPQPGSSDGNDDPAAARRGTGRVRVIDHGDGTREPGADGERGVDT